MILTVRILAIKKAAPIVTNVRIKRQNSTSEIDIWHR